MGGRIQESGQCFFGLTTADSFPFWNFGEHFESWSGAGRLYDGERIPEHWWLNWKWLEKAENAPQPSTIVTDPGRYCSCNFPGQEGRFFHIQIQIRRGGGLFADPGNRGPPTGPGKSAATDNLRNSGKAQARCFFAQPNRDVAVLRSRGLATVCRST